MRTAFLPALVVALLTSACSHATVERLPISTPIAQAVIHSAPSHSLAATSTVLLDTPILDNTRPPSSTAVPPQITAAPTEVAAPTAPLAATVETAQPRAAARLVIDAIGLDMPLVAVGLDETIPIVPDHDIGWFNQSAAPGEGDNVVLWGHALRFRNTPQIPAPFGRLKELTLGTQIMVYDSAGRAFTYHITQQIWATPDQVSYILPTGSERLTMVSCIGDRVITAQGVDMTHRLITIAEPITS